MIFDVFCAATPHPPIFVPGVGGSRAEVTHESLGALRRTNEALRRFAPETLVLISPHAPLVPDGFAIDDSPSLAGSLSQFGDETVHNYQGDPDMALAIADQVKRMGQTPVMRTKHERLHPGWLDHASLVPLSFLDPDSRYMVVVLSLSYVGYAAHRMVGEAVRLAAGELDRRVAFIASGDLSHRLTRDAPAGFSPRGKELDERIVELTTQGRFNELSEIHPALVEAGGECGLRSLIAAGGYCGEDPVPTRVLAYEGPWGVGYMTALAGAMALAADDEAQASVEKPVAAAATADRGRKGGMPGAAEAEIVALARAAIIAHVRDNSAVPAPQLSGHEYPDRAGAFVSLHRDGELRGCIGTILPTRESLAEEVAANAIEAATHDPRFPPLSAEELDDLDVKVDVLHAPEACTPQDLDPNQFGCIVTSGWRRGLLLPDLEGVDDVETQVAIAQRKGGIQSGEPCSYERFKVDRYT